MKALFVARKIKDKKLDMVMGSSCLMFATSRHWMAVGERD